MSEVFESLMKSLNEAVDIQRGEKKIVKHPCRSLPAPTYICKEQKKKDKEMHKSVD